MVTNYNRMMQDRKVHRYMVTIEKVMVTRGNNGNKEKLLRTGEICAINW